MAAGKKSIRTTAIGIVAAIVLAGGEILDLLGAEPQTVTNSEGEVVQVSDGDFDLSVLLAAAGLAGLGFFSRDDKVSDRDAGAA